MYNTQQAYNRAITIRLVKSITCMLWMYMTDLCKMLINIDVNMKVYVMCYHIIANHLRWKKFHGFCR